MLEHLQAEETVKIALYVLFLTLLINFASPTLIFIISFFEITSLLPLAGVLDWLAIVSPFLVMVLFLITLQVTASGFEKVTFRFVVFQGAIAFALFAIWFSRDFVHFLAYLPPLSNFALEVTYFSLVVILYVTFLAFLWKIVKKGPTLRGPPSRFRALYLWVNVVFLLALTLPWPNRIDFVYYFSFHMPPQLNWFFGYTPTIIVSVTCLGGWVMFMKDAAKTKSQRFRHAAMVIAPIVFVTFVETFRPLIGYVITSMIVWGASYQFFRPTILSLSLVLSAVAAYVSFTILIRSGVEKRNKKQITLSLASAVLAGISSSPISVIGVLTSLYILFHGISLREKSKHLNQNRNRAES